VRDNVTIAYRGAAYEIGRGPSFYGIWAVGDLRPQPLEWWPATPEGWQAAWARFTTMQAPATIVPVDEPGTAAPYPSPSPDQPAATEQPPGPASSDDLAAQAAPQERAPEGAWAPGGGPGVPQVQLTSSDTEAAGTSGSLVRAVVAAALLLAGVALGVAGLFSNYLDGLSLAQQPDNLVPHLLYLGAWSAAGLLVIGRPSRPRVGALLAAGTSIVTFGFLFADAGTAISGGAHLMGAGLVLSCIGWAICSCGAALACSIRQSGTRLARPRGPDLVPFWSLALAGVGTAAALAPAWDSYVIQDPAGLSRSLLLGNVFSNPAPIIAGNVVVMISLVAVVVVAALWRPVQHGSALLAGAVIPMVAQAVSALIQLGETTPASLGISSAQATRLHLTITAGLTLSFWLYCAFVVALVVMGASALLAQRSVSSGVSPLVVNSAPSRSHPYETGAQSPQFPPGLSPFGPVPPGAS
jgi:hypothetical protein